ncbi:hypothetical protein K488DRAFT_73928, partial [Vararia minispora EC-137]
MSSSLLRCSVMGAGSGASCISAGTAPSTGCSTSSAIVCWKSLIVAQGACGECAKGGKPDMLAHRLPVKVAHEDPVVAAKAAELAAHPAFIARINAISQEEIRYLLALSLVGIKLSAIVAFQVCQIFAEAFGAQGPSVLLFAHSAAVHGANDQLWPALVPLDTSFPHHSVITTPPAMLDDTPEPALAPYGTPRYGSPMRKQMESIGEHDGECKGEDGAHECIWTSLRSFLPPLPPHQLHPSHLHILHILHSVLHMSCRVLRVMRGTHGGHADRSLLHHCSCLGDARKAIVLTIPPNTPTEGLTALLDVNLVAIDHQRGCDGPPACRHMFRSATLCFHTCSLGAQWIASTLHSGKNQERWEAMLQQPWTGDVGMLVTTDLAGCGIDVQDVSLVINFQVANTIEHMHTLAQDLPNNPYGYLHQEPGREISAGQAQESLWHSFDAATIEPPTLLPLNRGPQTILPGSQALVPTLPSPHTAVLNTSSKDTSAVPQRPQPRMVHRMAPKEVAEAPQIPALDSDEDEFREICSLLDGSGKALVAGAATIAMSSQKQPAYARAKPITAKGKTKAAVPVYHVSDSGEDKGSHSQHTCGRKPGAYRYGDAEESKLCDCIKEYGNAGSGKDWKTIAKAYNAWATWGSRPMQARHIRGIYNFIIKLSQLVLKCTVME